MPHITATNISTTDATSAFAQDRFDVTHRFNLYLGLRMEGQKIKNDADQVPASWGGAGSVFFCTYLVNLSRDRAALS